MARPSRVRYSTNQAPASTARRDAEDEQALVGDADAADPDHAVDGGRDAQEVAAEGVQHDLLEDERQRDGGDQHRRFVLAHRLDHEPVRRSATARHRAPTARIAGSGPATWNFTSSV